MKRVVEPIAIISSLVLAVTALVVSSVTLYGIMRFRNAGLASVAGARTALAGLGEYTVEFSIPFRQTFPISAEVPLQQDFIVPIQTTLPFSAVVQVPVSIPILGTYQVAVPVEAEVPVDIQVIIPISQTVVVETTIAVDTEVPIEIDTAQLGLGGVLEQIDAALRQIEEGLGGGQR